MLKQKLRERFKLKKKYKVDVMKVSDSRGRKRETPGQSRNGQPHTAKPEQKFICLWQSRIIFLHVVP